MSPPPVSLIMSCYQQEPFIGEAVRSVLAQDYAPLEIVISDDCSRDATFDIAKEEVARYRGPHTVVLNRNPENMGLDHLNRQLELAHGELIVRAHGDDISLPHRTRRLVEAWASQRCSLISSNAMMIDAAGQETGLITQATQTRLVPVEEIISHDWRRNMLGASFAWEREVPTLFGPIDKRVLPLGLDHVFPFRAALLKGFLFLAEPLLRYRVHSTNMHHTIADRTGSRLAMEETLAAFNLSIKMRMGEELTGLRRRMSEPERLDAAQRLLQVEVSNRLRHWLRLRQLLLSSGQLPTWVDKSVLEAKGSRPELGLVPGAQASARAKAPVSPAAADGTAGEVP